MPAELRPVELEGPDLDTLTEILNEGLELEWGERAALATAADLRVESALSENNQRYYLYWVNDRALAAMDLLVHRDDPDVATLNVRVLPEYQGYRIGQECLQFAERYVVPRGRRFLRSVTAARTLRDDRNTRFMRKAGFRELRSLLRQDLDLPNGHFESLHPAPLDDLDVVIVRGVPDLSVCDAICRLWNEQLDGEAYSEASPPHFDPHGLHRFMRDVVDSGRYAQFALLCRASSREVIGQSEVQYRPGDTFAEQYESYIVPRYASRESYLNLKFAGIRALLEAHPETPRVRAVNSITDAHITSANRELGFADVGYIRDWEKELH